MFKALRIMILLLILAFVGTSAWLTQARSTDWSNSLWVKIYPINADGTVEVDTYINSLAVFDFAGIEAFLQQYDLSSEEGVLLMCIAEALLRIPDADTADRLIADKITSANWQSHIGTSDSVFVNASTWGLMLTGKLVGPNQAAVRDVGRYMHDLVARAGEPVVRTALSQAMRIMGHQFVMGRTIDEALARAAVDQEGCVVGTAQIRVGFDHALVPRQGRIQLALLLQALRQEIGGVCIHRIGLQHLFEQSRRRGQLAATVLQQPPAVGDTGIVRMTVSQVGELHQRIGLIAG